MMTKSRQLRELLSGGDFIYMPSAATPIEGKLAEAVGTKLVYTGGYVTGASRTITDPMLTMDEQVRVAGEVARAVSVPLIADAGAGFAISDATSSGSLTATKGSPRLAPSASAARRLPTTAG